MAKRSRWVGQTIRGDERDAPETPVVRRRLSFREFLAVWQFVADDGEVRTLGDALWEAQERTAEEFESHRRIFVLKARQLGETTIECAWDGYVAAFGPRNARVSLFSSRDEEAKDLVEQIRFGLERLPDDVGLPFESTTAHELRLRAGPDDLRAVRAFPTGPGTSRGRTVQHAHVDELAYMNDPEAVLQAVQPTVAPNGSLHILTTGRGEDGYVAPLWRRNLGDDAGFRTVFLDALARPDRDADWYERESRRHTTRTMAREYPLRWEDALRGDAGTVFDGAALDAAGQGYGPREAVEGHRYLKAWDVGARHDASVGVVLDLDSDPVEVVRYDRLLRVPFPRQQKEIERVHAAYPGKTYVEETGLGIGLVANLDIPARDLVPWQTTGPSKERMINSLEYALESQHLRYSASDWPQLDAELRTYQRDDAKLTQDSVMALAIAVHNANLGGKTRREKGRARVVFLSPAGTTSPRRVAV